MVFVLNLQDALPGAAEPSAPRLEGPSVGVEGQLTIQLPGTLLTTKPVDPKAPMLLRIAEARPQGEGIEYNFRYIGLEPGRYDLREYVLRVDGSTTGDLPALWVEIHSVLPPDHDGILVPPERTGWQRFGGYRVVLVMAGTLWLLLLVPMFIRRRAAIPESAGLPASEPTLADRLRPLMERAAAGDLDAEGKAHLERLLIGHWRERLGLVETDMSESLRRLREHDEGGAILRALESWLHRRPGTVPVDLEPLLAPYRSTRSTPA